MTRKDNVLHGQHPDTTFALCGESRGACDKAYHWILSIEYFLYKAENPDRDITICKGCLDHPDLPLFILGKLDDNT